MSFSNPINVATASMEHIYERLCWIYATFRSTFVYDAIGQQYQLSDITQLSRAKIPYPELSNEVIDYKQNEVIIRELQMKDVLCARKDWISRGRLDHTMRDDCDEEGQEPFISMEGVSYSEPEVTAKQILTHVRRFLIYLLAPSNMVIGKIVSYAFEGIAPPSRATLSWVHELQRTEVALQNALSINRLTVARSLVKAMKCPLKDLDNFATFRQSTAIAYSLWERAFEAQYDQHWQTTEWVTQLIEYQLDATKTL